MSAAYFILFFFMDSCPLFILNLSYMYILTKESYMTTKNTLPHWNYMDRTIHARWDFTNLDRLPTDTDCPSLNALNARINGRNEEIEDMFIQIECDRIDREEAQAEAPKRKRKSRKPSKKDLFEDIDEATRQELLNEGFELE